MEMKSPEPKVLILMLAINIFVLYRALKNSYTVYIILIIASLRLYEILIR